MLHNNYAVLFLTFCNIKGTLFITNKARKDFFYCSVFSLVCFLLHCMDGGENDESKKMVAAFLAMAAATALIAGCGGGDKRKAAAVKEIHQHRNRRYVWDLLFGRGLG